MSEKRAALNTSAIKKDLDNLKSLRKSVNEVIEQEEPAEAKPPEKVLKTPTIRGFNVPEHILLVFDRVKDEIETDFFDCGDKKVNPRNVMHRVLRMFVYNKISMNDKHSYAIMTLNEDNSTLVLPKFSRNPQLLDKVLQKHLDGCDTEDIFNINVVFETILAKHNARIHYDKTAPDSVYRVIFCYGRSFTLPVLKETPEIKALLEAPNFFFDVVFTHESPSTTDSKYEEIFKLLQGLDRNGKGLAFSIERNMRAAHITMAKLLAHPLQRDPSKTSFLTLGLQWKPDFDKKLEHEEDLIDLN